MHIEDLNLLDTTSKIWIYQANRSFTAEEMVQLKSSLSTFLESWTSHNYKLKSFADIYYDRFIVLAVDESNSSMVSGCSIDTSVRYIKSIGCQLDIDFFDRLAIAYVSDNKLKTLHRSELKSAYQNGVISDSTLMFDNLVSSVGQFTSNWIIPLSKSWHFQLVK